jgi:nicotinic acid mononucleotide adenylyltransferase
MPAIQLAAHLTIEKLTTAHLKKQKRSGPVKAQLHITQPENVVVDRHVKKRRRDSEAAGRDSDSSLPDTSSPRKKKRIRTQAPSVTQQPSPKPAYSSRSIATPPSATTTSLAHYIRLTSLTYFVPSTVPYFHSGPVLTKGVVNRVLLYTGCFNPPHPHHIELLLHVWLRSGSDVIGAMLHPVGSGSSSSSSKAYSSACQLSKEERVEVLTSGMTGMEPFCWPYWGKSEDLKGYMGHVIDLAARDGYELQFVSLSGSDHLENCIEHGTLEYLQWATRDIVTSDVTRPLSLWDGESMKKMPGCGE